MAEESPIRGVVDVFCFQRLGGMPTANAEDPRRSEGCLKDACHRDLFRCYPPIRSGPSDFAVGMRRKVVTKKSRQKKSSKSRRRSGAASTAMPTEVWHPGHPSSGLGHQRRVRGPSALALGAARTPQLRKAAVQVRARWRAVRRRRPARGRGRSARCRRDGWATGP